MDLSMEIAERSLEVVRSSIEAAAARERDEAAARLLSELELEDASKKVHSTFRLCMLVILSRRQGCSRKGKPCRLLPSLIRHCAVWACLPMPESHRLPAVRRLQRRRRARRKRPRRRPPRLQKVMFSLALAAFLAPHATLAKQYNVLTVQSTCCQPSFARPLSSMLHQL